MALPTGTISLGQVNTELGRTSTAAISLGETAVRNLSGRTSGYSDMASLRGKSAIPPLSAYTTPNPITGSATSFDGSNKNVIVALDCVPTGGTGTYSYNWVVTTTSGASPGVSSISAKSPNLQWSAPPDSECSGYVTCTITSGGQVVTTAQVNFNLQVIDGTLG